MGRTQGTETHGVVVMLGGEQSLIEKLCLGASLVNEIKYGNCFRVAVLMNR